MTKLRDFQFYNEIRSILAIQIGSRLDLCIMKYGEGVWFQINQGAKKYLSNEGNPFFLPSEF